MEKLILRGVMYGADKIPDSWFEKIPGNYYKHKPQLPSQQKASKDRRRRYSDDYDNERRFENGRRHDDRKRRDSDYQERSDSLERVGNYAHRRREHRNNENFPPRNHADGHKRRASLDMPRPDSKGTSSRHAHDAVNDDRPHIHRPISPFTATAAAAGAAAGTAATSDAAAGNHNQTSRAPYDIPTTGYSGYVPYSHIYGTGDAENNQANRQPFSPPPASSVGSVQPSDSNQITTSRHQVFSPEASVLNGAITPVTTVPSNRDFEQYDGPGYDRYDRWEDQWPEHDRYREDWPQDRLPYRGRDRTQDVRSQSHDMHNAQDGSHRARSERRYAKVVEDSNRGKSTSVVMDTFDKSQKGLNYGMFGALAGGIVGSEMGKGAMPAAIGAVLGGFGANMFEARQRFVDPRRPLNAQMRAEKEEMNKKQLNGKKEQAQVGEVTRETELRRDRRERQRQGSSISD